MDKGTVVRIIVFALSWVNAMLANRGIATLPYIGEETIAMGVAFGWSFWTAWKNNSITKEARLADEYLKELKKNK